MWLHNFVVLVVVLLVERCVVLWSVSVVTVVVKAAEFRLDCSIISFILPVSLKFPVHDFEP